MVPEALNPVHSARLWPWFCIPEIRDCQQASCRDGQSASCSYAHPTKAGLLLCFGASKTFPPGLQRVQMGWGFAVKEKGFSLGSKVSARQELACFPRGNIPQAVESVKGLLDLQVLG